MQRPTPSPSMSIGGWVAPSDESDGTSTYAEHTLHSCASNGHTQAVPRSVLPLPAGCALPTLLGTLRPLPPTNGLRARRVQGLLAQPETPLGHQVTPAAGGGSIISARPLGRSAGRLSKAAYRGRRKATSITLARIAVGQDGLHSSQGAEVASFADSAISSGEDDPAKTGNQEIVKHSRCFYSVRAALTEQRARSSELTRVVLVCTANLDHQSVVLERLMLDSAAAAEMFAALKNQMDAIASEALKTLEEREALAEEEDTVPWIVSLRVILELYVLRSLCFHLMMVLSFLTAYHMTGTTWRKRG